MGFSVLVNSKLIKKSLLQKNKIFLFILPININVTDFFNFRSFLNSNNLYLLRLSTKHLNRIIKTICSNEVVSKKYQKYDLNIFNSFFICFNDFICLVFIIFYISDKFSTKINFLYLKINNVFVSFSFINLILKQIFFEKNLMKSFITTEIKKSIYFSILRVYNTIKIIFFKFVFIFKLLLIFKFYVNFYRIFIK